MERSLGANLPPCPGPGLTANTRQGAPPPLALYIHTPWCVSKCPYCDFNSHASPCAGGSGPPFSDYVRCLLADLDEELRRPAARRAIASIFIGGGTPSLFPGASVAELLDGIRARTWLAPDCEVTLEANPGAGDVRHFADYRRAGVNRLSIGIQSLSGRQLRRLGRIHDPVAARGAIRAARGAGFDNLNLDLMYALPEQTLAEAREDLLGLIDLDPEHLSYYQLTLEPNTAFHANPPRLPEPDLAADMGDQGRELIVEAGLAQYEVSAYARAGRRCRHNLNYWSFGDYLGIGAGAHGKLRHPQIGEVRRRVKHRHPDAYLAAQPGGRVSSERILDQADLTFEFALNVFRLTEGIECTLFEAATGLPWSHIAPRVTTAIEDGLLRLDRGRLAPTELGRSFVDTLVGRFLA